MNAHEARWEQIWQTISQSAIRHNKPNADHFTITDYSPVWTENGVNKSELCTKCNVEVGVLFTLCGFVEH